MTDPTRPTDAELEAGHARLLALDTRVTITPFHVPYVMTAEEVEQAQAAQATVAKWNWPELKAYYESIRSMCKEPVWTARQRPREPRFMDCTLPPPDPLPRGPLSPEAAAIYERLDEPHVVGSLPSTRGRPYPQRPPAQGRRRHGFQA